MLKSLILSVILSFTVSTLFVQKLEAQHRSSLSKKNKKKKEDEYKFIDHLWFGGQFTLQFYSTSLGNGVPGNIFNFGISPMVGYKFTKWLSVGPRLEYVYVNGRFDNVVNIWKLSSSTFGYGAFARAKFLGVLFSHLEYSRSQDIIGFNLDQNNKLLSVKEWNDHFYLGLGYNSGDIWAYEFYLLYDFLASDETIDLPITFRFGLTYKF